MNFRTTSTIEEQMNHVKKYAPLLLLNIPRKYQYLLYIPFFAIFADLIFNLLNSVFFVQSRIVKHGCTNTELTVLCH